MDSDEQKAFYVLHELDGKLLVEWIADDNGDNTLTLLAPAGPESALPAQPRYRSANRRILAAGVYRVGANGTFDTRSLIKVAE